MNNTNKSIETEHLLTFHSDNGRILFSLFPNEWESHFFKRPFALLDMDTGIINDLPMQTITDSLDSLLLTADNLNYEIVEIKLDSRQMVILPFLEAKGFRLVDTHAVFITRIRKDQIKYHEQKSAIIRFADPTMKAAILNLTHRSFSNNSAFYSRFKNRLYFNFQETEKYYSAYIDNNLSDSNTLFAVATLEDRIIGYLIYKYVGAYDDRPLYKGILVAVDEQFRGNQLHFALQSFIYNTIPHEEYYLHTTTQLNNISTLNNYIESNKRLNKIVFILYRKYRANASSF
jgi:hypothetical protein